MKLLFALLIALGLGWLIDSFRKKSVLAPGLDEGQRPSASALVDRVTSVVQEQGEAAMRAADPIAERLAATADRAVGTVTSAGLAAADTLKERIPGLGGEEAGEAGAGGEAARPAKAERGHDSSAEWARGTAPAGRPPVPEHEDRPTAHDSAVDLEATPEAPTLSEVEQRDVLLGEGSAAYGIRSGEAGSGAGAGTREREQGGSGAHGAGQGGGETGREHRVGEGHGHATGHGNGRAARQVPTGAVEAGADGSCPEGFPIKGNASSRIYHVPGSGSYEQTIPEYCFDSSAAAEAAGFRAPKR